MKAKTLARLLVTSVVVAAMAITASAAFAKKNTYSNQFSDVKETSWYAKEVASAYELGFVEGVSATEYSPDTTVTVAQGITMATRVHAEYNGKTIAEVKGGKWYDMYVNYAKENGIITENQFDDYTREIKRFEMAELFYDAMGEKYYTAINDVVFIPDVPMGAMYMDKLLTLYNAGVVMGNDEYGSFSPDANIKRSECAAIINRVALPENRLKKELADFTSGEAYTLVYNSGMSSSKEGINSGWVLDNRGGPARLSNSGFGSIGDVSEEYSAAYVREFNYIPAGRLVTEINLTASDNGAFLEYRDIEENTTYMLKIVDGKWSLLQADGTFKALTAANGKTLMRLVTDLDTGKSETVIDGVSFGEGTLLSDNIFSLRAGIDEKGIGSFSIGEINVVVNYAMYEDFNLFGLDSVYGWTATEGVTVSNDEIMMSANNSFSKSFEALTGNDVLVETYFITRDGKDFTMNIGDVLKIENKGKKLVAGGKEIYDLTQNMWYRLRVDVNTIGGHADIWLNGRVIASAVPLDKNGAVSSFGVECTGLMGIDNIKVHSVPAIKDYCPAPSTKASLDDYIVAMNICSLWRNGTHYGWACITPHDDRKPVIGYYDEGVPETADWEIKFMVEHGIDAQAFCWYGDAASGPLKTPDWSAQLHDGFMYAKYSDYMKYLIQWETSATEHFKANQFRNYVIPYWFENYFLDDRYLKIDNKLVVAIYNAENLATDKYFGSADKAKAELDYLEKKAKEYGFDGVILLASGSPSGQLEKMGFDGTFAYSWQEDGRKMSVNQSRIEGAANASQAVHGIPTVSMGFDSVPWHHLRYGIMGTEEYNATLKWVRDEHLPNDASKPDWAEKFVWLSTWNEYGEGTFISPAGQNGDGFCYVDQVRDILTDLPKEHVDAVPTPHQAERINHLYPQYARLLRRDGWYKYNSTLETSKNEPKNKLFINDQDILALTTEEFHIPPVVVDGKVYFPFNPSTAVNYVLGCHYEWRQNAGTLKIMANGHEVMFEIGSDVYKLDGERKDLGYTVTTLDGIPHLDFVKLAKDLEYKVEEKDGNVYIFTDTYEELFKNLGERTTGTWEFNLYDSEGWDSTHFEMSVGGGSMLMVTNGTSNDPAAHFQQSAFPEDFYTARYTDLEIRVKYDYESNGATSVVFYFITDKDTAWNEAKSIKIQLKGTTTDEWEVYKVSLANYPEWQNAEAITGLRLDPFNTQGTFEIDYIRFVEDPDFEYVAPEEKPFAIENGDAEGDVNLFYSSNTKSTIITDPDDPTNRVYYVKTNPGNTYAYTRYAATYEPGATYRIEFDVKLGDATDGSDASETTFCSNIRYPDKTASGGIEHIIREGTTTNPKITKKDGWVHYVGTHTVTNIDSNKGSEFTIYFNPNNGISFDYYLDNISVVKLSEVDKAKADPASVFDWETSEGIRYSFDKDNCGFEAAGGTGEVKDGTFILTANTGDPKIQLNGLKLDPNVAIAVAVRFKAVDYDLSKSSIEVFFATDKDTELSQSKSKNLYFKDYKLDENGYYTAVVNVASNELWKDTITTIRVDPANAQNVFIIDEVMIMEVRE